MEATGKLNRRRRFTDEERRRHCEEQERSGQKAARYCRERGLSCEIFYRWRKRYGQDAFRRVEVIGGSGGTLEAEVVLGNGATIRLMRGCSAALADQLLRRLGC